MQGWRKKPVAICCAAHWDYSKWVIQLSFRTREERLPLRISSQQIINFIKMQSAFMRLLPSSHTHTWRWALLRKGNGRPSGAVTWWDKGWMKGVLWGGDKWMDGWGFDVEITTSTAEGQPKLDLELCVSWNAGLNSLDSCPLPPPSNLSPKHTWIKPLILSHSPFYPFIQTMCSAFAVLMMT